MQYKFFVYCPAEPGLIQTIIDTAAEKGAGTYGNYSHVAFVTDGTGHWRSEDGARPVEGAVGEMTQSHVARVEMTCDAKDAGPIARAVKAVHPWEQVDIEFVEIKEIH